MAFDGRLPKHLEVAARTGVLIAQPKDAMPWRKVAMEIPLSASTQQLVDLGSVPAPTRDPKAVKELIEKAMEVTPQN